MMSTLAILHLDWQANPNLPSSLVVKLATQNETNLDVARRFKPFLKEVNYYRELSGRTSAKSPKVYAAEIDEAHNFYLLMEDASAYRMGDQVIGATKEECEFCTDFLVNLHTSFWNKLDGFEWIPNLSGSENAKNMALGCDAGWSQMLEHFGEVASDELLGLKQEYVTKIPAMQEKLGEPPVTLVHGDFRQDNLMFGESPEHERLLVIDFQGPQKGRGIYDLAFFLGQSASTEVRREHEANLVGRYVHGLKSRDVKDYSADQAWSDYRLGILYAWTLAVVIAGTLDPTNERGFAWMSQMIKRNSIAINDLDCLQVLGTL